MEDKGTTLKRLMKQYMSYGSIAIMLSVGIPAEEILNCHKKIGSWDDFLRLQEAGAPLNALVEMCDAGLCVEHFTEILDFGADPITTYKKFWQTRSHKQATIATFIQHVENPKDALPYLSDKDKVTFIDDLMAKGLTAEEVLEGVRNVSFPAETLKKLIDAGSNLKVLHDAADSTSFWACVEDIIRVFGMSELMSILSPEEKSTKASYLMQYGADEDIQDMYMSVAPLAVLRYLTSNNNVELAKKLNLEVLIENGSNIDMIEEYFDFFVECSVNPIHLVNKADTNFILKNLQKILALDSSKSMKAAIRGRLYCSYRDLDYDPESFKILKELFGFDFLVKAYEVKDLAGELKQLVEMPDCNLDQFLERVILYHALMDYGFMPEFYLSHGASPGAVINAMKSKDVKKYIATLMKYGADIGQIVARFDAVECIEFFATLVRYGATCEMFVSQCRTSETMKAMFEKIVYECSDGPEYLAKLAFTPEGIQTLKKLCYKDGVFDACLFSVALCYAKLILCIYVTEHSEIDAANIAARFTDIDIEVILGKEMKERFTAKKLLT